MRADEVFKINAKNSDGKMVDKEIKMLDVVDAASLASVRTMIWQRRRDDCGQFAQHG